MSPPLDRALARLAGVGPCASRARGLFLVGVAASGGVGYAHPRLRDAFLYPYNLAPDHLRGVRIAENGGFGLEKRGIKVTIDKKGRRGIGRGFRGWTRIAGRQEATRLQGSEATRRRGNQATRQSGKRNGARRTTETRRHRGGVRLDGNSKQKRRNHRDRRERRDWGLERRECGMGNGECGIGRCGHRAGA